MSDPLTSGAGATHTSSPIHGPDLGICPRCGARTEDGYLATGNWLNWVREKGTADAAIWRKDKLITAADTFGPPVHVPGWRCRVCGLVLLDFSHVETGTPLR
jgi:hypothetical protein